MNELEAIQARHSVRSYEPRPLGRAEKAALQERIAQLNAASGLHIQLVCDEPRAFDGFLAHYGKFSGVTNYLALVGRKGADLDEKCGYYGEQLVLLAQQLGLNTCWVALTYSKVKEAYEQGPDEKLPVVIALGYGTTQGTAHKSRPASAVSTADEEGCAWFEAGVEAALLAPTAMNQQKFTFSKQGSTVSAKAGLGFYAKLDLGIVKLHFELGAGKENFTWA